MALCRGGTRPAVSRYSEVVHFLIDAEQGIVRRARYVNGQPSLVESMFLSDNGKPINHVNALVMSEERDVLRPFWNIYPGKRRRDTVARVSSAIDPA